MKPYYSNQGQTIYHGAAQDVLPLLDVSGVDAVLTDPPYGIDGGSGNVNRKRGKGKYLTTDWADTREYVRTVCVPVIEWCIKHVGRVVLTPGKVNLWLYPEADDVGDFYAEAALGHSKWGFNCFNPILYYGADPRSGITASANSMRYGHGVHNHGIDHPCPKPPREWRWLLCKATLEAKPSSTRSWAVERPSWPRARPGARALGSR